MTGLPPPSLAVVVIVILPNCCCCLWKAFKDDIWGGGTIGGLGMRFRATAGNDDPNT
jgi:hypothetical protein